LGFWPFRRLDSGEVAFEKLDFEKTDIQENGFREIGIKKMDFQGKN